jgi:hypothetical protein
MLSVPLAISGSTAGLNNQMVIIPKWPFYPIVALADKICSSELQTYGFGWIFRAFIPTESTFI